MDEKNNNNNNWLHLSKYAILLLKSQTLIQGIVLADLGFRDRAVLARTQTSSPSFPLIPVQLMHLLMRILMEGCAQLPYCHHHKHYLSGIENIIERSDLSRIQTAGQSISAARTLFCVLGLLSRSHRCLSQSDRFVDLLVSDFCS